MYIQCAYAKLCNLQKAEVELTHFYTIVVFVVKKHRNDLSFPRFATDNSLGPRSDHSLPLSGPNKLTPLV